MLVGGFIRAREAVELTSGQLERNQPVGGW